MLADGDVLEWIDGHRASNEDCSGLGRVFATWRIGNGCVRSYMPVESVPCEGGSDRPTVRENKVWNSQRVNFSASFKTPTV